MGFLVDSGETYTFEESKKVQQYIKEQGIIQFLKLYQKYEQRTVKVEGCQIIWGDEIEFMLINMNEQNKAAKLQLNSKEIFDKFHEYPISNNEINFETKYEYGSWMIETTPDKPFTSINNINQLINNFIKRRTEINDNLQNQQDKLLYLSVFPLLGVGNYYEMKYNNNNNNNVVKIQSINELEDDPYKNFIIPSTSIACTIDDYYFQALDNENLKKYSSQYSETSDSSNNNISNNNNNPFSCSSFANDEIITEHQRFYTLTQNIRLRRGEKVSIQMPIYNDKNTKQTAPIYMDAMAFGMGNSCLQLTMGAQNIQQGRFLYDQLSIISPLFLSLSASSPIFKGLLSNIDTRWDAICQSVDDRNYEERDQNNEKYIPKSRYGSISYFISDDIRCKDSYNDINFPINKQMMNYAKIKGQEFGINLDDKLLQHLGFLFSRDALVIFKNKVDQIDEFSTEHFENLQSTNWNSVRFKPPPSLNSSLPWRVEFRTMDLQITDEENALLIYLVLGIALMFYKNQENEKFRLNFYLPISKVDQNFERAVQKNALIEQKFFFRKNIFDGLILFFINLKLDNEPIIIELSLKEFFFGNSEFIGIQKLLLDFIQIYLPQEQSLFQQYQFLFNFLKDRVEGKKLNTASWMRQFVLNHPEYKQDSIITDQIAYDLLNNFELRQSKKIIDDNFLNYIPKF